MNNTIKLVRNSSAIDALILTKDEIIPIVADEYSIDLEKIAIMGDSLIDLSCLTLPGLGLAGAPANAQESVIEALTSQDNGYVSPHRFYDGFRDFYFKATERGMQLVISDRNGVLTEGSNMQWGTEFGELALKMGQEGRPYVIVLTGSSYDQNIDFRQEYGLDQRLGENPVVKNHPYSLLVEGGTTHVNVLTGEIKNYAANIDPSLLEALKGDFEKQVRERIEHEVLPDLGFEWTQDYRDQTGKVYHIPKSNMVTFNLPMYFENGKPFRESPQADSFKDDVLKVMVETALNLGLPYEIL